MNTIYWKTALNQLNECNEPAFEQIDFKGEKITIPDALLFKKRGIEIPQNYIDTEYEALQYDNENDTLRIQILSNRDIDLWDEREADVFVGEDINGHATVIEIKNIKQWLQKLSE